MKRVLWVLAALVVMLSGCSSLPGEDRAFAVAMGVSETNGVWEVSVRVPTYQTGGGYLTLSARGNTLGEAMALLNASAPMEVHYGQLRLLIFSEGIARSGRLTELMRALAARGEVRPHAAISVTEDPVLDIMDALEPATGSRLSKSLEALLEARKQTGVSDIVTLDTWQRMGLRQQPVLMNMAKAPEAGNEAPGMAASAGELAAKGAGKVQLAGGWMLNADGNAQGTLDAAEMQLLALLRGELKQGMLSLPEGTITLLDADSNISFEAEEVVCTLQVRYNAATMTEEGVQSALLDSIQSVTAKLAAANCDALGIARKAIMGCATMETWNQMNWSARYPTLRWRVAVKAMREI